MGIRPVVSLMPGLYAAALHVHDYRAQPPKRYTQVGGGRDLTADSELASGLPSSSVLSILGAHGPSWISWSLTGDGWEEGQCLWVVVVMVVAGVEVEMAPWALVDQGWAGTPQRART